MKWGCVALAALLALALLPVASAQPPPLPSAFYGTFTVNGQDGPANLTIEAYVDGELRGSVVTHKAGWYGGAAAGEPKLVVQGDATSEGVAIQFRIGTYNLTPTEATSEFAVWRSGTVQQVDFEDVPDTTPPAADAGLPQRVNPGEDFTFDASASTDDLGIARYHWDFGDGTTGEGAVVQHAYGSNSSWTVTLTVTDAGGNTATDTTTASFRTGGGGSPPPEDPPEDPPDDPGSDPPDAPDGPDESGDGDGGSDGGNGGGSGGSRGGRGIDLVDANGRALGRLDPLTGVVFVSSPDTQPGTQWFLDDGPLRSQGPITTLSAHGFSWDTRAHANGAYDLSLRDGSQTLNTRRVVIDNPTIGMVELASATAVAVGTVAAVTGVANAAYIALGQAAQEAGITLSEDRLRTRLGGRERVWRRPVLFSAISGSFALVCIALGFSAEGLQHIWSMAYLQQLQVVGLAAVFVFAVAYLLEIAISMRAGLQVGIRFLVPGFISLVFSALVFRFPIGYPAYIADRPRDGQEELSPAWDALRNVAIVAAPLSLLLPLTLLRPHGYAFFDAAIEIVAIEVMVASLPIAPLPGAAVWRHRKSWSAVLVAGTVTLFAAMLLQSLGTVGFSLLSAAGVVAALVAQHVLAHRTRSEGIARVERLLDWQPPGRVGRLAALGSASVDAALALASAAAVRALQPAAVAMQKMARKRERDEPTG